MELSPQSIARTALCALVGLASTSAGAHTFKQLEVFVGQVQNSSLPLDSSGKVDLSGLQAALNDILRQCDDDKVMLRFTLMEPRLDQRPTYRFDDLDVEACPKGICYDMDDVTALLRDGLAEVTGGGVKLWIVEGLHTGVEPFHTKGMAPVGSPVAIAALADDPKTAAPADDLAASARIVAHEIGHSLGHNGIKDEAHADRLMFGAMEKKDGTKAGTRLTKDDCAQLQAGIDKRSPKTTKTLAQRKQAKAESSSRLLLPPAEWTEDHAETASAVDFASVMIDGGVMAPLDPAMYLDIRVRAPVSEVVSGVYKVALDLDTDSATGDFHGADATVVIYITGFGTFEASLSDGGGNTVEILDDFEAFEVHDDVLNQDSGEQMNSAVMLSGSVPLAALEAITPLEEFALVYVDIDAGSHSLLLGAEEIQFPGGGGAGQPSISVNKDRAKPGEEIEVSGSGFKDNTPYTLRIGDAKVGGGKTGDDGAFTEKVKVPSKPPGDYLVDAITQTQCAIESLRIDGPDDDDGCDAAPSGRSDSWAWLAFGLGFCWVVRRSRGG